MHFFLFSISFEGKTQQQQKRRDEFSISSNGRRRRLHHRRRRLANPLQYDAFSIMFFFLAKTQNIQRFFIHIFSFTILPHV